MSLLKLRQTVFVCVRNSCKQICAREAKNMNTFFRNFMCTIAIASTLQSSFLYAPPQQEQTIQLTNRQACCYAVGFVGLGMITYLGGRLAYQTYLNRHLNGQRQPWYCPDTGESGPCSNEVHHIHRPPYSMTTAEAKTSLGSNVRIVRSLPAFFSNIIKSFYEKK